jgi:hypothetical protein
VRGNGGQWAAVRGSARVVMGGNGHGRQCVGEGRPAGEIARAGWGGSGDVGRVAELAADLI